MDKAIELGVGFIFTYVLQLIDENRKLMSGTDAKIKELTDNLVLLKKFMELYTDEYYKDDILRGLADEIRNRVHEVEDVLETHIVEVSRFKNKNFVGKVVGLWDRLENTRNLGKAIRELTEKVKKACNDNKDIGVRIITSGICDPIPADNYTPASNQWGDRIIGFEDAADIVLDLLGIPKLDLGRSDAKEQSTSEAEQHSDENPLEIVSIHGMLGLGKTTLARKVLNDPQVEYHFFTRIFVSVSKDYNKKEVLLSILSAFIKDIRDRNMSVQELVAEVRKTLKYKYLIVMDDVWDTKAWEDLKDAFPDYNKGSRVLITTRQESMAKRAATKTDPYLLRFMTIEEAEELLRTKVFNENECPEKLQPAESRILKKCGGLPLAIVVTAGILRNDPENEKWWESVAQKSLSMDELDSDSQKQLVDDLIRRSYDNLRHVYKSCFLYLGVFPEDLEIQVSKLFQLWIAEGFIPQIERESMEETAERCLRELVDRNLVMVRQRTLSGRIKTCLVHDTLRDFCKRTAKAENLFQECDTGTVSSSSRRLFCINSQFSNYISSLLPAQNVRSFLSFGQEETTLNQDLCPNVFKQFNLLRVLDILSIKLPGPRFPVQLPNLVLLKFIAICCELKILPRKMSSLLNLQTLVVRTTSPTLAIEADIWAMTKLRHLHTNTSTTLPKCPDQSPGGENLQTLSTVSPESLTKEVFKRAKNLKKLGIRGKLHDLVEGHGESSLFDSLCELDSLENLKLYGDDVNSKLLALPQAHKFPPRLTRLSLHNTSLDWNYMSILGNLRYLEVLKLKDYAFKGDYWKTKQGGFPSLKVFFIGATDLTRWDAKANDFPELKCLILKQCKTLERIPADFVHMKKLEMIKVEHTKDSVVSSARRIVQLQLEVLLQQKSKKASPVKLIVYPPEY
ncbi:putative late blight resistance protein homolog R1A-10 [Coffea eugenioides]|uniref:putative late blight resistance protein homolog R1A-10 n=1 Tax=Coffea eugenioides TaxID=49369 RepID=UPI000F606EBF|nr:putative late blight resistance protein homolog R1A-10 [Coffea eugenioides]XP_027173024.1 putative late blight resistance protein homolog R1A-10 [Coffea eugenioides]